MNVLAIHFFSFSCLSLYLQSKTLPSFHSRQSDILSYLLYFLVCSPTNMHLIEFWVYSVDCYVYKPSGGSWDIEAVTGGRRGPDGPLDVVVVFCGQTGETAPQPLVTSRENAFQIGQSDAFKVRVKKRYVGTCKSRKQLYFLFCTQIDAWVLLVFN